MASVRNGYSSKLLENKMRTKLPTDRERAMGMPEQGGRNYVPLVLFFLVPTLVFIASWMLFLLSPSAQAFPFELGRFAGTAELYSHQNKQWTLVTRKNHRQIVLHPRDKIRTQNDSDLDFRVPGVLDLRLKASSELEIVRTKRDQEFKFKLNKGGLLGLTGDQFGTDNLQVVTPHLISTVQDHASFLIQTGKTYSSTGVLTGQILVQPSKKSKQKIILSALETSMIMEGKKIELRPKRINDQEWKALNEVRDLTVVTPEKIAGQVGLRKKAGNFFNYVFDEGAFFQPNWSYAEREFYEDAQSQKIILQVDYDVFPRNSFSGLYFKTRNLDLSKVHRIGMSVKSAAGKPIPDQFRIELKDRFSTARAFTVKSISRDWKNYSFELKMTKPTPAEEIAFVFENSRIGTLSASGTIYIKDLVIE